MKIITIILLIVAVSLWMTNYYSLKNSYKELKANPIHDTVYIIHDVPIQTDTFVLANSPGKIYKLKVYTRK